MARKKMTYKDVGVDYELMDPFKRSAQRAGLATAEKFDFIHSGNFKDVKMSRGESVHLIERPDEYLAHLAEGLGTKNLVADEMYRLTGKTYYDHIAQDTVAMIVNDMITLGAVPLSVAMHLAVGNDHWFKDEKRYKDLVHGWKRACFKANSVWGCGETATLKDVVDPVAVVLSGSATGFIKPKGNLINADNIRPGDAIVFIESSGIHANGLTMARRVVKNLPNGYLTKIGNGRTYGETLLDATHIYVELIEQCMSEARIHYAVNITGHGWRKLMRAPKRFAYVIENLPAHQLIFRFMQKHGPIDDAEAYANFNMGAGFALYVDEKDVNEIIRIALSCHGLRAFYAGHIERSKQKKVVIKPKGLEYGASALRVR